MSKDYSTHKEGQVIIQINKLFMNSKSNCTILFQTGKQTVHQWVSMMMVSQAYYGK
jgi:hypothetical protein